MATTKTTPDRFIRTWNRAGSLTEVSEALGITTNYATVLATKLRHKGKDLKYMPRGDVDARKRLMTRTTEEEHALWEEAADKSGLSVGGWSRLMLDRAAQKLGFEIPNLKEITAKLLRPPRSEKEPTERVARTRLMTRTSHEEYEIWAQAARKEGLTIGPWSRMILNRAARELGFELDLAD